MRFLAGRVSYNDGFLQSRLAYDKRGRGSFVAEFKWMRRSYSTAMSFVFSAAGIGLGLPAYEQVAPLFRSGVRGISTPVPNALTANAQLADRCGATSHLRTSVHFCIACYDNCLAQISKRVPVQPLSSWREVLNFDSAEPLEMVADALRREARDE